MAPMLDRRGLLKSLGWGTLAVGAGGAFQTAMPAWAESAAAQGTPPRAGIPRIIFSRASLANGIIPFSGETSMELYHSHPHDPREEVVQPEDIRTQTRLTMRNHKEILDWLGLDWRHVVKLTRFQKSLDESKQVEEVLASYFRDTWPPMSVYQIDGLSSPQARIEIEVWVVPDSTATVARWTEPAPIKGLASVFPRPEIVRDTGYNPGIWVAPDMDLVFMSGLTPYPFNVDPWNPGEFRMPADPQARGKMATGNLQRIIDAAGITWQHLIFRVSYTAPGGGGVNFQQQPGTWRSCSTSLRVNDTGIPGVNILYEMTAAAPRRAAANKGPVPGVEALLVEPGMTKAPAIRVSSDVDLIYFSGITAYPIDVDPWNPGSFSLPQDNAAQEKMLADNVERMLKAAGITWQHIVVLNRTGEGAPSSSMTERMGAWRPCRTTRAVPSGVPGARVLCDITAVAPRKG